jgi:hypothetical protein
MKKIKIIGIGAAITAIISLLAFFGNYYFQPQEIAEREIKRIENAEKVWSVRACKLGQYMEKHEVAGYAYYYTFCNN